MKKSIIVIFALFFFIGPINTQTNNSQATIKNQLKKSIESTIEILKEMETGRRAIAEEKLDEKKIRSNFVVWYYNYLVMIENDPNLSAAEKELSKDLLFKEANRVYKERHSHRNWLNQAQKSKIDKEFLEYYLAKDRFLNLVLWVYEKLDEDIKTTEEFFNSALADSDPMAYVLKDLNENIKIVSIRKHRIKRGETLGGLFGNKWKKIAAYNKIKDPAKLRPGDIILIPEQAVNIPKDADKVVQFCILAANKLVDNLRAQTVIAEVTLAILRVETDEGRLIGTATYHSAMNPTEKIEFLRLCLRLGLDPETAPVSQKPSYGWGGAMGPGQFLPSTWGACEADVSLMSNQKFVSPYNLKHAIFAIASKLIASGVASGGSDAEQRATMRYFAGKNWDKSEYQFYWDRIRRELEKIRQNKEIESLILKDKEEIENEIR